MRVLAVVGALLCLVVSRGQAQARRPIALVMPSGWNDSYFARLDEGRKPKTVVAVMNFAGGESLESRTHIRMADALITSLVQAGRFDVVERDRLDLVMTEQNLTQTGRVDPATAARVGKILGAELVVFGLVTGATEQKIDKFSYDLIRVEVSIDVRAVNVSTGRVVISENARGSDSAKIITTANGSVVSGPTNFDPMYHEASQQALNRAALLVSAAAPLVGYVVARGDQTLTIDLGEDRGVKTGDTFIVFRRGAEIVHPVTRERVGWEKSILAAIEVTTTESDLATARILNSAAGSEIRPGDFVVFRPAP
jgi:hypothetical protein